MKDFKNYLQKIVQDAEKNDSELSRVAEALYILSDYMEEAGDSQIDCIDGRMMTRIFDDTIEVIDYTGVKIASLHLDLEMDDREEYTWTDEDEVNLISIGRQIWSTLSIEKRNNYALGTGTYGFIEELCDILVLPITDSFEQFDRVHDRIISLN